MKNYITLLLLIFLLTTACNKQSKIKHFELKKVNQTTNNDFSFTEMVRVINNKVYSSCSEQCKIFEYDLNLKKIREYGKKGKGPQEFVSPINIAELPDGRTLVNDLFNIRLAYLNQNGVVDSTFKYKIAYFLENDRINNKTLVQRYPMYEDTAIFEFKNNNLTKVCDVTKLKKDFNLERSMYTFTGFDDEYILSFEQLSRIFKQNKNKEFSEFKLSYLPKQKNEKAYFGKPIYNNGFVYIPYADATTPDDAENGDVNDSDLWARVKLNFYILKAKPDGTVTEVYTLAKKKDEISFFSYNAWDIHNNKIYAFDLYKQELVSYEMPL